MKKNSFLSEESLYLSIAVLISVSLAILPKNLLYGILFGLIGLGGSFYARYKVFISKKALRLSLAQYSFLSCFLTSINEGFPLQGSYEQACRFLVGYQDVPSYDEMKEAPERLSLPSYDEYVIYAFEKDKENEVHLHDFKVIIKEVDEKIAKLESDLKKNEKEDKTNAASLLLLMLALSVFFFLYPQMKVMSDTIYFRTFGLLSLALLYPGYSLLLSHNLKEVH